MKRILFALVMLGSLLLSCAPARTKVLIATDATYPPMEFVNDQKELTGFDVDMVKEVAKAGGFEVEFRLLVWDGIFDGLSKDTYDAVVSSVVINDERASSIEFSDPYINAGQVVVVAKNSPAVSLVDLKGQPVGVQSGTPGALIVEKTIGKPGVRNFLEIGMAFEDLFNGKVAAVVTTTPIAAQYALQNTKYKGVMKILGQSLTDEYYGIAVKKGNKDLLDKINKGVAVVKANGRMNELMAKWLR